MKKILIIDVDRVLRQTLAAALETEGCAVAEAANGREGLNKALQGAFDLVVLDIVMPELGGLEVCRKLRESGRQIPTYLAIEHAVHVIEVLKEIKKNNPESK